MARPRIKEAPPMTESAARLDQIIRETSLSRSAFARKIGMTPSGMSHIFLRGGTVSNVIFRAVANEFELSQENKEWLLYGGIRKGERLMPVMPEPNRNNLSEPRHIHKERGRPRVKEPVDLPPCMARLLFVVKQSGLSKSKFGLRLGMSRGGFINLFRRGSKVSPPLAKAVQLEFGCDQHWLLTGTTTKTEGIYNPKEIENFNSEAHQRYRNDEPKTLGGNEVDLPEQSIFYDKDVPLEKMTVEHLWLGGTSTPKVLVQLVERLLRAERKITALEMELKYYSGQ